MTNRDRDLWSWAGIWLVGGVAAVWSFSALSDLAVLVGYAETIPTPWITVRIAWGLPISLDALAVVATRIWLRNTAQAVAVFYARRVAWAAIVASTAGNAYNGWLTGGRIDTVIVGMVPSVALAVLVHMAVLVVARLQGIEPAPRRHRLRGLVETLRQPTTWGIDRKDEPAPFIVAIDEAAALFHEPEALDVPAERIDLPTPPDSGVFVRDEGDDEPEHEPAPVVALVRPDGEDEAAAFAIADDADREPAERIRALRRIGFGRDRIVKRTQLPERTVRRVLEEVGR